MNRKLEKLGGRAASKVKEATHGASEALEGFQESLIAGIRERPVESVLLALGAGLLLGRFRVRPVEALVVTGVVGLVSGMCLTRSRYQHEKE